ncbi:Protein CBG27234 [Caenorhabditis briggsae]|uniref:Protein CBG27234 n=1 Tax=Caenorhabditis briggsae TaxID=6238 RepID=B6IFV7_CAEBR|nr:Protein CBG27234 [Caenorhabditis briggsae]CAR98773.1 Protein CBG27234 [Caenorhabditis briggsae]
MKVFLFLIFVIPTSSFIWGSTTTTLHFDTTIVCRDRVTNAPVKNWCYTMKIFDSGASAEIFEGSFKERCLDDFYTHHEFERNHTYYLAFTNYVLESEIEHNCTTDGRRLIRKRKYSKVPGIEKRFDLPLSIDLFEDGTEVITH